MPFASPSPSPPAGVQPGGVAVPVPVLNMAQYLPGGAHEDIDVAFLLLPTIQMEFNQALNQLATATSGAPGFGLAQVTQALGKALIYDQSLSVNNNLACATCHEPYSGFTGGSSFFNATTSADPGQWFEQSAMGDLLDEDFSLVEKNALYRCLDKVLKQKERLFGHLRQRWQDLFGARFEVLLYDLTSTYFESDPPFEETDKRQFGYSRDKRPDCVQVVIG